MEQAKKIFFGILFVVALFAGDIFVDWPNWWFMPEMWICPGESTGFQFCTPWG